MFTNAFSLVRFSCERVLGLFSAPEGGVSNTPNQQTQKKKNVLHISFCVTPEEPCSLAVKSQQ
jgi:hypothetical protein